MNLFSPQTPYDLLVLLLAEQEGELSQNWQRFQEWAVTSLEAGLDSPSLRILAGLYPAMEFEVRNYLERIAGENGWTLPNRDECLYVFARKIAALMVLGQKPLAKGCKELYLISMPIIDRYPKLSEWNVFDDEFELMDAGVLNYPRATLEKDVLLAATALANDDVS